MHIKRDSNTNRRVDQTCSSVLVATSTPRGRLVVMALSSICCLIASAFPDRPAMLLTISKPEAKLHHGIRSAMRACRLVRMSLARCAQQDWSSGRQRTHTSTSPRGAGCRLLTLSRASSALLRLRYSCALYSKGLPQLPKWSARVYLQLKHDCFECPGSALDRSSSYMKAQTLSHKKRGSPLASDERRHEVVLLQVICDQLLRNVCVHACLPCQVCLDGFEAGPSECPLLVQCCAL
jgi:hypothetical protein